MQKQNLKAKIFQLVMGYFHLLYDTKHTYCKTIKRLTTTTHCHKMNQIKVLQFQHCRFKKAYRWSILTGSGLPELEASLEYFSSSKNRDGMSFSAHNNKKGNYITNRQGNCVAIRTIYKKSTRKSCAIRTMQTSENKIVIAMNQHIGKPTLQKWHRNFSSTNSQNIFFQINYTLQTWIISIRKTARCIF